MSKLLIHTLLASHGMRASDLIKAAVACASIQTAIIITYNNILSKGNTICIATII